MGVAVELAAAASWLPLSLRGFPATATPKLRNMDFTLRVPFIATPWNSVSELSTGALAALETGAFTELLGATLAGALGVLGTGPETTIPSESEDLAAGDWNTCGCPCMGATAPAGESLTGTETDWGADGWNTTWAADKACS